MSPPLPQPFQLPHRLIGNTFYLFYIFSYLNMFFFCLSYSSKLKNCVGLNLFHLCISVFNLHYQSSISLSLSLSFFFFFFFQCIMFVYRIYTNYWFFKLLTNDCWYYFEINANVLYFCVWIGVLQVNVSSSILKW